MSLIFFSCNNDNISISNKWNNAQEYYANKEYDKCLVSLNEILNSSDHINDFKAKSLFLISEIYLNEYKEYDLSISFLDKILIDFPVHKLAKRSLFTKAYINANYIESFSEAIILYNLFIDKYPNDELVSSVKYELNELEKYNETINSLMNQ